MYEDEKQMAGDGRGFEMYDINKFHASYYVCRKKSDSKRYDFPFPGNLFGKKQKKHMLSQFISP